MAFITHIGTAVPNYPNKQSAIQQFMIGIHADDELQKRKLGLMYSRSGIECRYSVIPDYSCAIDDRVFFPKNESLEPFPDVEKRMQLYSKTALPLALKAVGDAFLETKFPNGITHLISVSCTGMSAPGLDIELVQALNLPAETHRTSVNFMGCYAAIHALKQADAICRSQSDAKVLVVLVELCTLHFQKESKIDFLTSNLLFGDGAACCLVQNSQIGMQMEGFYSQLFLDKQTSMAWDIGNHGFLMTLKPDIPNIIRDNIRIFIEKSLSKNQFVLQAIKNWAIHPGGREILDATATALRLDKERLEDSYEILKNYGNMSSCSLMFILNRILKNKKGLTFVAGFGPGITMESVIVDVL